MPNIPTNPAITYTNRTHPRAHSAEIHRDDGGIGIAHVGQTFAKSTQLVCRHGQNSFMREKGLMPRDISISCPHCRIQLQGSGKHFS